VFVSLVRWAADWKAAEVLRSLPVAEVGGRACGADKEALAVPGFVGSGRVWSTFFLMVYSCRR